MKKILFFVSLIAICSITTLPAQDKDNWKEYQPAKSRCTVLTPGTPSAEEKKINTAAGEIVMHVFMYAPGSKAPDGNAVYGIIYADYPADIVHSDSVDLVKSFFDNSRDGAIKNADGKLISEKEMRYAGYPGREMSISVKGGIAIMKMRYYLIKNRVYMMQVITMAEKNPNKSIDKFLDSFKLM